MSNCTWQSMAPWQEVSIVVFLKLPLCHYGVIKVLTRNLNCVLEFVFVQKSEKLAHPASCLDWRTERYSGVEPPRLQLCVTDANPLTWFLEIGKMYLPIFPKQNIFIHIEEFVCWVDQESEAGNLVTWIRWQALPVDKWCKSSSDLVIADLPLMQAHLWIYLCRLSMAYVKNKRSQVLIIRWKCQLERSHNKLFWENIKAATWYAWEMWYTTYYSIEQ